MIILLVRNINLFFLHHFYGFDLQRYNNIKATYDMRIFIKNPPVIFLISKIDCTVLFRESENDVLVTKNSHLVSLN